MNFFVVFTKTRKKFDKYVKVNKLKNKYIIDIKKMMEEESIMAEDQDSMQYFKILVYKRIMQAMEKEKDIYYLPNFDNSNFSVKRLLNMRTLLQEESTFNLLLFHDEFNKFPHHISDAFEHISEFTNSQILKDY